MKGRCAGCGLSGSVARVSAHARYCPEYRELYRSAPERALSPEEEYARWQDSEERQERREQRREAAIAEADRRRDVHRRRWATPPDPLE